MNYKKMDYDKKSLIKIEDEKFLDSLFFFAQGIQT